MPITPCAPCDQCIGGNIPNDKFKQDVEVILCQILAASGSAAKGEITTGTHAVTILGAFGAIAFGSLSPNSLTVQLGVPATITAFEMNVEISLDGGVTYSPIGVITEADVFNEPSVAKSYTGFVATNARLKLISGAGTGNFTYALGATWF